MNKLLPILPLIFTYNVIAETVTCTSSDPDLKIKIEQTFLNPNSGSFEYLQLKVEKKSKEFAERIHYKTLVKRKRTVEGFEYVGLPTSSDVSLKINSKDLIVSNIKADLLIKQNTPSARQFEGLSCTVEGEPFPAIEPCPKVEELNSKLLSASRAGNLESMQDLLTCGADPSVKDEKGCSPLLNLAFQGCGEKGQTQWGHIASRPGIYEKDLLVTIDMMLSQGAVADERDPVTERTAVHLFSITGQTDALSSLLDYEADVNAQDTFGNTPLMYAAASGNGFVVKTINDYKPERAVKNKEGKTAYAIAEELKHRHLLPLLEVAGQQVKIDGNKDGSCSPLSLHLKSGPTTFILNASSKMFMLTIPGLDVELMASAGQVDSVTVNMPSGMYDFTCGIHGGKEYKGSIMAH